MRSAAAFVVASDVSLILVEIKFDSEIRIKSFVGVYLWHKNKRNQLAGPQNTM